MKFGKASPEGKESIHLPDNQTNSDIILGGERPKSPLRVYLGLPKWGKADVANFYPKGTKDVLGYYSSQFNAIEFNAFFYRIFKAEQVVKWRDTATKGFKFFPKIPQQISQFRRLKNVEHLVDKYLFSISHFNEKLGTCFLQMHPTFSPESFKDLEDFITSWPIDVPLAVELRHPEWYSKKQVQKGLVDLLAERSMSHIITDTIGRRDLLHMRLTTKQAFVRFTAANTPLDHQRIDEWIEQIKEWRDCGLEELAFFFHVQAEKESSYVPSIFVQRLNDELDLEIVPPAVLAD